MILLVLAVLSYVALVLDSGCGSWSLPASTVPQFLYLASAVAVLTCRGAGAIIGAAVAGLLGDVVGGGPMGLNVVLLANLSFLSQMAGARQWRDSVVTSSAFILVYVGIAGFGGVVIRDVLSVRAPDFAFVGIGAVSRAGGTVAVYLIVMMVWGIAVKSIRLIFSRRTVAADRPKWAR